jgi:glycosyltransferase involved in cell wall biosynthesis
MIYSECDVCLILEGTYPYVRGGVSSWTDELIRRQSHLKFHIVSILPQDAIPAKKYEFPDNVVGHTDLYLQHLPKGGKGQQGLITSLEGPLENIMDGTASLKDFENVLSILTPHRAKLGTDYLLNSREAWDVLTDMYRDNYNESSILDYFWTWRAVMGSLLSILLFDLPRAKAYHTMCTGYAGLLAARAKIETGKPTYLTEHGIYTNERRIEIASADWLLETTSRRYTIDHTVSNLRDLWINTFANYSRICYDACDRIVTLYEGNQQLQQYDGADPAKMAIIPNGVDVERFRSIEQSSGGKPTIAMIGRVVPIKDVKSFIRACAIIRDSIPELKAFILGPFDEDEAYFEECREMVEHYELDECIEFTGQVRIDDYLPDIDVVVFTSISEAQPLVILEAGACGIPVVATNVGACEEMLNGKSDENPPLPPSGIVTPLANPAATAQAVITLLTDETLYLKSVAAARERVARYYDKKDQHAAYRELYAPATGK